VAAAFCRLRLALGNGERRSRERRGVDGYRDGRGGCRHGDGLCGRLGRSGAGPTWLRGRCDGRLCSDGRFGLRSRGGGLYAIRFQRGAEAPCDGGFNAGGRSFDELAHFLQFGKGYLAVDAEFGCDLVYAWFCSHNSPVPGLHPERGRPLVTDGSHFEPLISYPLAIQPVL
jgi:hypothetical protein